MSFEPQGKYSDGVAWGTPGHGLKLFAASLKVGRRSRTEAAPAVRQPAQTTAAPAASPATSATPKWAQEAAKLVGTVAPTISTAIAPLFASTRKSQTLKEREEAGKEGRAHELAIAHALGLNVPHFRAAVREGIFPPANFTSERNGETFWNIDVAKQAIAAALAAQTN
jgi:hypothetical protein